MILEVNNRDCGPIFECIIGIVLLIFEVSLRNCIHVFEGISS